MTRLTVLPDAEAVARRAADVMANRINDARRRGDDVHIALAGGSTPQRAYELLADMQGTWSHVHLWLSDERCVPADHEDANQRMVHEALLSKLRAADRPTMHGIRGELGPEDAAWLYARELQEAMGPEPVFELLHLGLGPDGHTASLFPGSPALAVRDRLVVATGDDLHPHPRLTFTFPAIARCGLAVVTVEGSGKVEAWRTVRSGGSSPAAQVRAGRVVWLVSAEVEAAALGAGGLS